MFGAIFSPYNKKFYAFTHSSL